MMVVGRWVDWRDAAWGRVAVVTCGAGGIGGCLGAGAGRGRLAVVAGDVLPPPVIEVRPGLTPAPIDSPGQGGLSFTKSINPKGRRSSNPYRARLDPLPAANGSPSQSICATSPEKRADPVAYPIDPIAADLDGLMELPPAFTMVGGVLTFDPDGHLQR
jgi:hypothetical protein